ncbi:MAG: hypothetical protein UZ11_BCD004001677, partial [Bacteroidetes bacterium OLB11]
MHIRFIYILYILFILNCFFCVQFIKTSCEFLYVDFFIINYILIKLYTQTTFLENF